MNGLLEMMTKGELMIVETSKAAAVDRYDHGAGWRLENMWSLAWI
ncbi:MAG: hypothetical protein ACK5N9_24900 [Pirellula sp.]